MKIFSKWFKGKKTAAAHQPAPQRASSDTSQSSTRSIRYDPELVGNLREDHKQLVAMYKALGDDVRAGVYTKIPHALLAFKTRLDAHLLIENVRFYVYLEQSMADDHENLALIRGFRSEMNKIARGVVEFVRRYQSTTVTTDNVDTFIEEYGAVGTLLAMRIEHEESNLYTLYHPH
ncbi:MAG: hemerythrin domain-containing protein [Methylobacillus sp.]|jgi:hypothetical protein|nr:hemerythrin domain-containing protein [Methylobacillus sp.]